MGWSQQDRMTLEQRRGWSHHAAVSMLGRFEPCSVDDMRWAGMMLQQATRVRTTALVAMMRERMAHDVPHVLHSVVLSDIAVAGVTSPATFRRVVAELMREARGFDLLVLKLAALADDFDIAEVMP